MKRRCYYWTRTLSDGNTRCSGRRGALIGQEATASRVPLVTSRMLKLTMYRPEAVRVAQLQLRPAIRPAAASA